MQGSKMDQGIGVPGEGGRGRYIKKGCWERSPRKGDNTLRKLEMLRIETNESSSLGFEGLYQGRSHPVALRQERA